MLTKPGINLPVVVLILVFAFLFACFSLASGCKYTGKDANLKPIEPVVGGEEGQSELALRGQFAVINPEMAIFDLDVNWNGTAVLFGSAAKTVSLLDQEGSLKWEFPMKGQPVQTRISSQGENIAVGTDEGVLYYLKEDKQQHVWKKNLEYPVQLLEITPDGAFLLVATGEEGALTHCLYYFDHNGNLLWKKETLPLNKLTINEEGDILYISEMTAEGPRLLCLDKAGRIRWSKDELQLASISQDGTSLVALSGKELVYLRSNGAEVWRRDLDVELTRAELTVNGDKLVAYSIFSGGGENLFFYDRNGRRLWEKKVPDGSLITLAPDGSRVVITSWQQYREDFSEIIVINHEGELIKEVEMSSRVEHLALSGNGRVLVLAGSEGNVYILGFEGEELKATEEESSQVYYLPVSTRIRENEMKVTLFFYDDQVLNLVPVTRWVQRNDQVLSTAIEELIKGPCRRSSLSRTIPKEARIDVYKEEGTVYLDMSAELAQISGSAQVTGIVKSLLYTVSQYPEVQEVQFLVEGQKEVAFGGEGMLINSPFKAERFDARSSPIYYLPYKSGERYYLLPRKVFFTQAVTQAPEKFMEGYFSQSRYFYPGGVRILGIQVDQDVVKLDLSSNFKLLFPEGGTQKEKERAAMIVDSLILTIAENFPPDDVHILVDGKEWYPPEGYPELRRKVIRPFFINPES